MRSALAWPLFRHASSRVGGAKATLYSCFISKEELSAVSMAEAVDADAQQVLELLKSSDDDLATLLRRAGTGYAKLMRLPHALALTRIAVSEGANAELGAMLYERDPQRAIGRISEFLSRLIRQKNFVLSIHKLQLCILRHF